RGVLGAALDHVEGAVDNLLGDRLLAVVHHGVHELRNDDVPDLRIRDDLTLLGAVAAGHAARPCPVSSSSRPATLPVTSNSIRPGRGPDSFPRLTFPPNSLRV